MKITFLGTGAADWNIEKHKDMEGFRRNSSVLIDDCLLVDPGPCVPDALASFGKSADSVKYIINTHRHGDHFCEDTVRYLDGATFFGSSAGDILTFGKYTVTCLPANHMTCNGAQHFIISDGEKSIFYGLDGAWLLYDEMKAISAQGGVDLAVLDATIGDIMGDYRIFEHNNLNMVREIKASLEKYVKRWVISHLARTLHTSHDELSEKMGECGIEAAYDGLEIEI